MNILVEHIQYLLRRHDCVIIPGIGALIASVRPAYTGTDRETIMPPGRTVCFNAAIANNDGLIASSIARREGISFEAAREKTDRLCATMQQQLQEDKELQLAGIGTLHLGNEGNITFHPDGEYAAPLFFGLQPLTMPTLARLQCMQNEVTQSVEESQDEVMVRDRRYYYFRLRKSVVRVAACACAAALLWIAGVTFLPGMLQNVDTASLLPSGNKVETPVQNKSVTKTTEQPTIQTTQTTVEECDEVSQPEMIAESTDPETGMYYLIVASTKSQQEIDRFMEMNADDTSLKVVSTKSMIRVYIAKSDDRETLVAAKRDTGISSRYPEAWIWQAN